MSTTGFGAGAYLGANSQVLECLFQNNNAFHGGGGIAGAPAIVKGCTFIENWGEDGGALYGGWIVIDSIFVDNIASFWGGAARSTGTFINCTFMQNRAEKGGALWGSANAINCLFIGNNTWGPGTGGAVNITDSGSLVNCSVVGNFVAGMFSGSQGGGVYKAGSGTLTVTNCVIWANEDVQGAVESSQLRIAAGTVMVNNSCIQGWTGSFGGTGNHGNDPRFIDADGPDDIYGTEDDNPRLLPNSPLIDQGDTSALPPDTFDLDEDGDTTEPIPLDLDWLPRIVGETVDVGAYEFQGTPCLADITGDGQVNDADLLSIIGLWGSCIPGQPCNADVTLDGIVTTCDLLLIINAWGVCAK